MGHRHLFSSSPLFEAEPDQCWNHTLNEDPYRPGRSSTGENVTLFPPEDNMSGDRVHYVTHWNPSARLNGYPPSSQIIHVPHTQSDVPAPHDSLHPSAAAANMLVVPENHASHASSSSYSAENNFYDTVSGRGPYKRKSPGIPTMGEIGGSSGYYSAGSSSDVPSSSNVRQDRLNLDVQPTGWEAATLTPGYRPNNFLVGGESSMRNVRSRPSFDLESDAFRTHTPGNYPHNLGSARHHVHHSSSVDLPSPNPNLPMPEWNHIHMSNAYRGRTNVPDHPNLNQDLNHIFPGSSANNASGQMVGYNHDHISSRTPVPQSSHATSTQVMRGIRSSFSHRSNPAARVSVGSLRLGHAAPFDEGPQLVGGSYSSRHLRPFGGGGWRNSDRSGRSRLAAERYRSLSVDTLGHDRMTPEAMMIIDGAALYGSRNLFDQHRDMRLDVDNMSYEELLALGDRIGCVNTGLSEGLLEKCLTATVYCSSDHSEDEERCAICLEEYKNMDDISTLKACGHDYHVSCVKKWLSMKNSCPICKVAAVPDNMKDN